MAPTTLPPYWAFITITGDPFIVVNEQPVWVCRCGNDADRVDTRLDPATGTERTQHICGVCAERL